MNQARDDDELQLLTSLAYHMLNSMAIFSPCKDRAGQKLKYAQLLPGYASANGRALSIKIFDQTNAFHLIFVCSLV